MRTRQVRHVRWVPAAGHVSHFFDDDLVCASVGVHPGLRARHRAVPDRRAQGRTTRATSPAGSSSATRSTSQAAAERARAAMNAKLEALCAQQVPGDTYRNLAVRADWSGQTYKHILAPVWLLSYDYGRRASSA